MILQLYLLALSWVMFFILHSVLADQKVKTFFYAKFPTSTKYYRLIYNFVSTITIFPAIYLQLSIQSPRWFYSNSLIQYLAYLLILSGIVVMILAFKNYQTSEFIGIIYLQKNNKLNPSISDSSLATSGLNAIVRHPLYFGILLSLFGYLIHQFNTKALIMGVIFSIYLIIGTYLEEKKLIQEFGEDYKKYQKNVKMLIPYIF